MNITTTKRLNNGVEMPCFGLGVFKSAAGEETLNAVRWALEAGYRHIDTAAIYGNEESVGQAIRECGIPREEIFLTTKLWNDNMRKGTQQEGFEESLQKLGTDYVDLYLIHWPVPDRFIKSWKVMEHLYKNSGRIRAIGVSNFHQHHLDELIVEADVVPAVNQVECHPRLTQEPLFTACDKLGIAFEAWSPMGGSRASMTEDPLLNTIGKKYGKTAAQVILRWDLQRGIITIPKSVRKERIIQNANIFDFQLTDADMSAISAMNRNQRAGADPENFNF